MKNMKFLTSILVLFLALATLNSCIKDDDMTTNGNIPAYKPDESSSGYPKYNFGNLAPINNTLLPISEGYARYIGAESLPEGTNKDFYCQSANGNEGPIANAFDGTVDNKIYHSPWKTPGFYPVDLEFVLAGTPEFLDFIQLIPRGNNGNGSIHDAELFIQCEGKDYESYGRKTSGGNILVFDVRQKIRNPRKVKIRVYEGAGGFVSLSEIQCYQETRPYEEYMKYFANDLCTELKPEYDRTALENIGNEFFRNLALTLHDQKYDLEHRVFDIKTYPSPTVKAKENGTASYGFLDNATGVYVEWNENVVIFVDETQTDMVARIVNPMKEFAPVQEEPLHRGINVFTAKEKGLIYIIYQSGAESSTRIHIPAGTVNGVFDISKHKAEEWAGILAKTTFTHLDILGKYTHLLFTTSDLRAYTSDGTALAQAFDSIVYLEQEFTGLLKYKNEAGESRMNKTRLCVMALNTPTLMFATDFYTGYTLGSIPDICNVESLLSGGIWGPAHELGHVNQLRPGFKWGSYSTEGDLTEVSNNVYAMYVQSHFGNPSRLEEQDDYHTAFNLFFINKQPYGTGTQYVNVFARLVPMWQLQLYFANALGYTDFYKDLHETIRQDDYSAWKNASVEQVKYCMNRFAQHVSDVAQTNMVQFFNDWGFNLTAETVAAINAKGYEQPKHEIRYISDNNADLYKNNAPVSGGAANVSVIKPDMTVYVKESCQNAVAFEVYNASDLNTPIFITPHRKFTFMTLAEQVVIKAVGADGTRVEVQQDKE